MRSTEKLMYWVKFIACVRIRWRSCTSNTFIKLWEMDTVIYINIRTCKRLFYWCCSEYSTQTLVVPKGFLVTRMLELEIHNASNVELNPVCLAWVQVWGLKGLTTPKDTLPPQLTTTPKKQVYLPLQLPTTPRKYDQKIFLWNCYKSNLRCEIMFMHIYDIS